MGNKDILNHYGLATIKNADAISQIRQIFNATGKPVFIIHNVNQGLMQGDLIRFTNKTVEVDRNVWQTLKQRGILKHITPVPVVYLKSTALSSQWTKRANRVKGSYHKGYQLGAEILKVFEERFLTPPEREEIILQFNGKNMVLIAPQRLLRNLKFRKVKPIEEEKPTPGRPFWISGSPSPRFIDQPFQWTVWAADINDPSPDLSYSLSGDLPPGLIWNKSQHRIEGTPTSDGSWEVSVTARNKQGKTSSQKISLAFKSNQKPVLANTPPDKAYLNSQWSFTPLACDPDHPAESLSLAFENLPDDMSFDEQENVLTWTPTEDDVAISHTIQIVVSDPLGATRTYTYKIRVLSEERQFDNNLFSFEFQQDTLTQYHRTAQSLEKEMQRLRELGVTLSIENSSDTTILAQDSLILRPMNTGKHTVTFKLTNGDNIDESIKQSVFVRPNQAPLFLSRISIDTVVVGQRIVYTPVVIDSEHEPVTLSLDNQYTKLATLKNNNVTLSTGTPGVYFVELTASDPHGNQSKQGLLWCVKKQESNGVKSPYVAFANKTRAHRHIFDNKTTLEYFNFRLGTFIRTEYPFTKRKKSVSDVPSPPFITFGRNWLIGSEHTLDEYAITDLGFTFRNFGDIYWTMGMYFNFNRRWKHSHSFPLTTEINFDIAARDLFMYTGAGAAPFFLFSDADTSLTTEDYIKNITKHIENLKTQSEIAEKVKQEFSSSSNMNASLQLHTYFEPLPDFLIGPTARIFFIPLTEEEIVDSEGKKETIITNTLETSLGASLSYDRVFSLGKYQLRTAAVTDFHFYIRQDEIFSFNWGIDLSLHKPSY